MRPVLPILICGLWTTVAAGQDLIVSASPANATPGQLVSVSITNVSTQTYTLPSGCVYRSVHATGCHGAAVFSPFCTSVLSPIAPGQTKMQLWDQADDLGQQVVSGTYSFRIDVFDPSFQLLTLCASAVVISACTTPPIVIEPADPGTGGIAPRLGFQFEPVVGNLFRIVIEDGLGGSSAALLLGTGASSTITPWGTFLLDPSGPILLLGVVPLSGLMGAAGEGAVSIPAQLPNDPALLGVTGFLQVLIPDTQSTGGISHTNALRVAVCP